MFWDTIQAKDGTEFEIKVHPSPGALAIIINLPGLKSDANGSRGQYLKIGAWLCGKGVGAYIQMPHQVREGYPLSIVDDLKAVISYALADAAKLCATDKPAIYLVGSSAGAAVVAAFAHTDPRVKKILLIAPVAAHHKEVHEGLFRYAGEIYVLAGAKDEVAAGPGMAKQFIYLAEGARYRGLHIIPGGDHEFSSRENGMIASKAHLWAFEGYTTLADPQGGIELW